MKIAFVEIKNFRKLKSVRVSLGDSRTVLVGANNCGKTSAMHALKRFLIEPKKIDFDDISADLWDKINDIGKSWENSNNDDELLKGRPKNIDHLLPFLDIWIEADASEIYKLLRFIPTLDWDGELVGARVLLSVKDEDKLREKYLEAINKASELKEKQPKIKYIWPKNLEDFLRRKNNREFRNHIESKILVLDPDKINELNEITLVDPQIIDPLYSRVVENDALSKIIKISTISEQRGIGEQDSKNDTPRKHLRTLTKDYYRDFLDPDEETSETDLAALFAQQTAEQEYNKTLEQGFQKPFLELKGFGYPSLGSPEPQVNVDLSGQDALDNKNSFFGYKVQGADKSLPENAIGLGFQNLIYMHFKLLSFRNEWLGEKRTSNQTNEITPIHLVLIEEPEVNLHAQAQQVFVKKAYETLTKHNILETNKTLTTQMVVSTHSSHIVNEVDFADLRYFRRHKASPETKIDYSTISNLSEVFDGKDEAAKFCARYLKLTHCDMFFADAIIFVEGEAERLLVPQFIRKEYERLNESYLSIIQIGGSYAHKFKELIEQLGIPTLIITDLDSVDPSNKRKSCPPEKGQGYETANPILKTWHPSKSRIDELLATTDEEISTEKYGYPLCVAFQRPVSLSGKEHIPRTFEDALILQNEAKFSEQEALAAGSWKKIGELLCDPKLDEGEKSEELFQIVNNMRKGEFAVECIMKYGDNSLEPPEYISDGMRWLNKKIHEANETNA